MHGEKQNDIGYRLNEMNSIPEGISFDQASVWKKMEGQLQGSAKSKRRIWYYAAAVLILMIAGFIVLQPDKKSSVDNMVLLDSPITTPEKKIENQIITADETTTVIPLKKSHSLKLTKENKKEVVEDEIESVIKDKSLVQESITIPVSKQESDNMVKLVENKPTVLKSKFRIAHINELNTPQRNPSRLEEIFRNTTVFKKPLFSSVNHDPLSSDEKIQSKRKPVTIFSPISSSQ